MDCKKLSNKKCEKLARRLAKYYGFKLEKRVPFCSWTPYNPDREKYELICLDYIGRNVFETHYEVVCYKTWHMTWNHLNYDVYEFAKRFLSELGLANPLFPKDASLEEIELTLTVKGY